MSIKNMNSYELQNLLLKHIEKKRNLESKSKVSKDGTIYYYSSILIDEKVRGNTVQLGEMCEYYTLYVSAPFTIHKTLYVSKELPFRIRIRKTKGYCCSNECVCVFSFNTENLEELCDKIVSQWNTITFSELSQKYK